MKNVQIRFFTRIDGANPTLIECKGKSFPHQVVFTDAEKNLFRFEMNSSGLDVTKTGSTVTKLTFSEHRITQGSILASGMTLPVTIRTNRLRVQDGSADIIYDLMDGDTVLTHHELHLGWKPEN
jgi:uncharacterized beta-barrel protein YwiB (DUF1934 family)